MKSIVLLIFLIPLYATADYKTKLLHIEYQRNIDVETSSLGLLKTTYLQHWCYSYGLLYVLPDFRISNQFPSKLGGCFKLGWQNVSLSKKLIISVSAHVKSYYINTFSPQRWINLDEFFYLPFRRIQTGIGVNMGLIKRLSPRIYLQAEIGSEKVLDVRWLKSTSRLNGRFWYSNLLLSTAIMFSLNKTDR